MGWNSSPSPTNTATPSAKSAIFAESTRGAAPDLPMVFQDAFGLWVEPRQTDPWRQSTRSWGLENRLLHSILMMVHTYKQMMAPTHHHHGHHAPPATSAASNPPHTPPSPPHYATPQTYHPTDRRRRALCFSSARLSSTSHGEPWLLPLSTRELQQSGGYIWVRQLKDNFTHLPPAPASPTYPDSYENEHTLTLAGGLYCVGSLCFFMGDFHGACRGR